MRMSQLESSCAAVPGMIQLQLQRSSWTVLEWLEKVADFATWLPKHPGLVGTITIQSDNHTAEQAGSRYCIAASLLAFSFQQAAGKLPQTWKLHTNILSKDMMRPIPPASLTALYFCRTKYFASMQRLVSPCAVTWVSHRTEAAHPDI